MLQKYVTEMKLRDEMKQKGETQIKAERKEDEEWEKEKEQLEGRISSLELKEERKKRQNRKRNVIIMDAKWVEWVKNFRGGKRFLKENLMAYVEIGAAGKV